MLFSISFPHKENAILAFGNGTYLNAAVAPSIPPTTQMYKQERNANRAVATLRENSFEHLQPTKVGECWAGPKRCLAMSIPPPCPPHLSSLFHLHHFSHVQISNLPSISWSPWFTFFFVPWHIPPKHQAQGYMLLSLTLPSCLLVTSFLSWCYREIPFFFRSPGNIHGLFRSLEGEPGALVWLLTLLWGSRMASDKCFSYLGHRFLSRDMRILEVVT